MKLTEVQRKIVEAPLGPAIVTAGAGSGKTRVLTQRIVYLISEGIIPPDAFLALTFTNKAAGEMQKRVDGAVQPNYSFITGVAHSFVGTFHSFCARVLRKSIKPPYTNDFTIYDTADSKKVYKEVGEENIEGYKARLEESNAIDFDGLLEKTLELLESDEIILNNLRNQYKYILVDEFQDTNIIQYKIASLLAGVHKNIMVVGDEDQCIYSWRGADIENLNAFRRDFPNAAVYKLEENFRSSKNIVTIANRLVAENCNRIDKVLFSHLPDGKIELKQHYDERAEARDVALTIADLHHRTGVNYSDFAVLMRLNATSRNFEEQFRTFNIPHVIWGGFKFYERAEIKSAINYLRVLVNPRDEVALVDALNWPKRGIGDSTIEKLRPHFPIVAVVEGLSAKARAGIENYLHTINSLRDIHDNFGLHDLGASLISTIGLDQYYGTGKEDDLDRLENLYQLEQAIKSFAEHNPEATLAQYLQSVALVQDTDTKSGGDAVVISTVHSAKGLEFKHVFVMGLEDGLFPLARAKQSTAEMEEERRLLYVAITRARHSLTMSYCQTRFFQGDRRAAKPSEFLEECGLKTPASQARHPLYERGNNYPVTPFGRATPSKEGELSRRDGVVSGGSIYSRQNSFKNVKRQDLDEWLD